MYVIVEEKGTGQLGLEERITRDYFKSRGAAVYLLGMSALARNSTLVIGATLVVGSIRYMEAAARLRGTRLPNHPTYPNSLNCFLDREISLGRLLQLTRYLQQYPVGVFIKPAVRTKRFTGFLCRTEDDFRISGVPRNEPVWFSEPVEWVSEWRYYLSGTGLVRGVYYSGDANIYPDPLTVVRILLGFRADSTLPNAGAIDIGVLSTGQTSVVEFNDAWSIGYYGTTPEDELTYMNMLMAGWKEVLQLE